MRFSGHETFHCRHLWLKKGFDFVKTPNSSFSDDSAVIDLGVGKNMVQSINFWLKAFGILEAESEYYNSALIDEILNDDGFDPYLEDIGTLWLLHYKLVSTAFSSIYPIVFNDFRKTRTEFTKVHLFQYINNHIYPDEITSRTLESDISVFLKTYLKPAKSKSNKNIEDRFSALLLDLELIKRVEKVDSSENEWYTFNLSEKNSLPLPILYLTILDTFSDRESISFQSLLTEPNSPGSVFLLTPDDLISKINRLVEVRDELVYKDDAGIRELQIKNRVDPRTILTSYYEYE